MRFAPSLLLGDSRGRTFINLGRCIWFKFENPDPMQVKRGNPCLALNLHHDQPNFVIFAVLNSCRYCLFLVLLFFSASLPALVPPRVSSSVRESSALTRILADGLL